MLPKVLLIALFCDIMVYASAQIIKPCKLNDNVCMTKSAKKALPLILAGIPSIGVESSDPLYQKSILGNLSILKYNLSDSTVYGYKNCDINNVRLNLDKSTLKYDLTCPFSMSGTYTISGRLIVLPVEGDGPYSMASKKYQIGVESEVKKAQGKDGIDHLQIKNFKLTLEAQEGVYFDFQNLFNGRKDLADAVLTFANKNWKEVADLLQVPVFTSNFKAIIANVNKFLKTVPFEDMFLQ